MRPSPVSVRHDDRPTSGPAISKMIAVSYQRAAPIFSRVAGQAPFHISEAATVWRIARVHQLSQGRANRDLCGNRVDDGMDGAITGTAKRTSTRFLDVDETRAVSSRDL